MINKKKAPVFIYFLIIIAVILVVSFIIQPAMKKPTYEEITYKAFMNMLDEDKIEKIEITSNRINIVPRDVDENNPVYYKTGITYVLVFPDSDLKAKLDEKGVDYGSPIENGTSVMEIFSIVGTVVFLVAMFFVMRSMSKKMGSGVMSFGKNTSKIYAEKSTGKTFADVAGQEEAKVSLVEIIDFLNNPQKYTAIGAKLPKGALLVGPPGTGKTLLAKAVAGEAKVPFFSLSGSEFVEMFVGMGAARVRDLFKQAVANAPCIVFIDEIDAIGKSRDSVMSSNDEREQTLNQLLSEMDGFDSSKGVVILAATNRPEVLDKALLRPGRFDRRIIVDLPDQKGRVDILKVHIRGVLVGEDIDLEAIAKQTPGASGADLENMINEAALRAVRAKKDRVTQHELEEAVEVILAGEEKKNKVLSDKEKHIVAYHEIGHALVSSLLKHTEPVHKITIIPRTSGALGYTMQVAEEEKSLYSKDEAIDQIIMFAGGRAAEQIQFNSITSGASNDIERATEIARQMVTEFGMSDTFGFMNLEQKKNIYLSNNRNGNYSEDSARKIDEEVYRILSECYDKAVSLLSLHKEDLDKLAQVLYEKENISGEEFMKLIKHDKEETDISEEI